MKIKQQMYLLAILAAVLLALGAFDNLWFFTAGGFLLGLYLTWRYLAFLSLIGTLQITVLRHADKVLISRNATVAVDVTISSTADVTGVFTDLVPDTFAVADGANAARLPLRKDAPSAMRYTLKAIHRADAILDRSTFMIANDLFAHLMIITSPPLELTEQPRVVSVDASAYGVEGLGEETVSTPLTGRYRERPARSGLEISHIKPYVSGDPVRSIHWKASAKLNRLMTKVFLSDLRDVVIGMGAPLNVVVDQSSNMGKGKPGLTELDFAVNVASYFTTYTAQMGRKVSLVTYDEQGIVNAIRPDDSPAHVAYVVKTLNKLAPRDAALKPVRKSYGVTGVEAQRIQRRFASQSADQTMDDETQRFRDIISYLYAHDEGYTYDLYQAPAFRAIRAALGRSARASTLVLITDLEGDLDPIIEGMRFAVLRGFRPYIIVIFSHLFEHFEDPLIAVEEVYAAYEKYIKRLAALREMKGVHVIEANAIDRLGPEFDKVVMT